jgi:hypothetical protein
MRIEKDQFINVAKLFFDNLVELVNSQDYKSVEQAKIDFDNKQVEEYGGSVPNAPELNSSIWLDDVCSLFVQCCYAQAWIKAWRIDTGSNIDWQNIRHFYIQYYIDDISIRLLSARDKLYLSILAYFIPFDPRVRLPGYADMGKKIKRIEEIAEARNRGKSGEQAKEILKDKLRAKCWEEIKRFRDEKVHKREPVVFLQEATTGELRYWIPVWEYDEVKKAEEQWKKYLSDDAARDLGVNHLTLGTPVIDGVTYLREPIVKTWDYEDILKHVEDAFKCLSWCINQWMNHLKDEFPYRRNF